MTRVNPWADQRLTDRLGKMIDAGVSSRVAAAELGQTRSAVIARASRLGWHFGVARTPEQRRKPYKLLKRPGRASAVARSGAPPEDLMYSIQARFDHDTMDEIRAVAERRKVSQAEAIRLLVEWGLEVESEAA